MIKDYWIYQRRNVPTPWALYVVKEFDRRKPDATTIDFSFFHEDVPTATHSHSVVDLHYESTAWYVKQIVEVASMYVEVTDEDVNQLLQSIESILRD